MATAVQHPLLIHRVGRWWEAAKDYWDILRPMRFCVFVWVAITLLITAVPQSRDALLALFENVFPGIPICDDPGISDCYHSLFDWLGDLKRDPPLWDSLLGTGHLLAFAAGALFWAWQTFYWARFASRLPRRPRGHRIYSSAASPPRLSDAKIDELNERIPRRLGGLVLISVWAALVLANLESTTLRIVYDVLYAGLSAVVALLFAYHGGRIRVAMFAVWAALFFWAVNIDSTSLNPVYEITLSAMMVVLFFAYWGIVRRRRDFANDIGRKFPKLHLTAVPPFSRDLGKIKLSQRATRLALALAIVTLATFLASGFRQLPTELASAVAIVWMVFGWWAAGELWGVPRGTKRWLRVNVVLFVVLFLVSINPNTPGIYWLSYLHSPAIIMTVAALWVFVGTFLLAVPGETLGLPVTSIVVVFAILVSFLGYYDNHSVREMPETTPWSGLSLDNALEKWWTHVPKPADPKKPVPLVLVATAGGASRAAFWTTEVLAQIEQNHPGFHKHIFAISSVSGGSLGAVVYRTMLNEVINDNTSKETADPQAVYCEHDGKATKKNMLNCGLTAIDHDFLGPTFLTGLYADMTQRFLPGSLLPDRASALERSREQAWRRTMPNSSKGIGLDTAFHSLWNEETWLPALIINGTSEKTGRRIITSNLVIDANLFTDALDYFKMISPQHDIAVSTAAHNSARFPYIDAAGTLMTEGRMTDRIVDGGYFENFGAGSIYDLLRALNEEKAAFEGKKGRAIKFFVIQISSDPELEIEQPARDKSWREKSPLTLNIASDLTAPPVALYDTGSALGYRATQILKGFVNSIGEAKDGKDSGNEHYSEFRLTNKDAAMSWVLSRKSVDALNDEWNTKINGAEYDKLQAFMKPCWDNRVSCASQPAFTSFPPIATEN